MQRGAFIYPFTSLTFIPLDLHSLIEGLFAAGAGMITFGALLGKASPTQVVLLLLLEVPAYCANAHYLIDTVFGERGAQARCSKARDACCIFWRQSRCSH